MPTPLPALRALAASLLLALGFAAAFDDAAAATRKPGRTTARQTVATPRANGAPKATEPAKPAPIGAAELFDPVRAQLDRAADLATRVGSGPVTPAEVEALLRAGRVDDAADATRRMRGAPREVARVSAQALLARYEFARARPFVTPLLSRRDLDPAERALRHAWWFVLDDLASVDRATRGLSLAAGAEVPAPDLLAAGRLAYELMDYARAESCYTRVLASLERVAFPIDAATGALDRASLESVPPLQAAVAARAAARRGMGLVLYKRRDYDGSLAQLAESVKLDATADGLMALCETLIRLGRTDDAVTAAELAVRRHPYHEMGHYMLGNGYARKTYTELFAAYPAAFADDAGRRALARADSLWSAGRRPNARAAYQALSRAHPGWADVHVRLASLDFEDGRYASARERCFTALRACPEYGRAHATLAKALESQRFEVDVHRPAYERRFAAAAMPRVPGIEKFVVNWKSLSPRHQKRVALSVAPWQQYIPVLVEGGSTYYIKPLHELLSESPGLETLRDTRIDYDSRLWDDVRGAGGYNTVTGIEDIERTIFDRYNTVLHELTHQVHGVLTADQSREIQEHYRRAKARDDSTKNGFLSRYAGGSVWEYFAEGANAQYSPKRDDYDPREVVLERMRELDPDLEKLVTRLLAIEDVGPSYPVAYVNAGDDQVYRGKTDTALPFYEKALARNPAEETALRSYTSTLALAGDRDRMLAAADRARAAHPSSGPVATAAADAQWRGGRGLDAAIGLLERARAEVRAEDRYQVDGTRGRLYWIRGDAAKARAAYDSVLAYQSDSPEGLWGKAASLALAKQWNAAFDWYEKAVRMRTGIVNLRCDYARDLIRAGRLDAAKKQLDEAALLDPEHPTAEALRGWLALERGQPDSARVRAKRALAWGEWSDLARIVLARAEARLGNTAAAGAALAPVRERIVSNAPPEYVYRKKLSQWESVHELPAWERELAAMPTRKNTLRNVTSN